MAIAFGILLISITAAGLLVTLAAFVWAAIKDGEDNDQVQSQLIHRRFPRESK